MPRGASASVREFFPEATGAASRNSVVVGESIRHSKGAGRCLDGSPPLRGGSGGEKSRHGVAGYIPDHLVADASFRQAFLQLVANAGEPVLDGPHRLAEPPGHLVAINPLCQPL